MKGYPAMMNHTNCVNPEIVGKSMEATKQIATIYESWARELVTKSWER